MCKGIAFLKPILLHEATLHNLKSVDVAFPTDKLIVVTGVSGSGKSTLVFDVLFEAGRKSYLRAIGILDDLGEDKGYREITGLRPTVANKQGTVRQSNPRSVVGTKTGLWQTLGTMYADYYNRTNPSQPALTAPYFSFNSPLGMCLKCEGRGHVFNFDFAVLLPDAATTLPQLYENALSTSRFKTAAKRVFRRFNVSPTQPFKALPQEAQNLVLYGDTAGDAGNTGLYAYLKYLLLRGRDTNGALTAQTCAACDGYRIGEEARDITINGKHIGHLGHMTIDELGEFLNALVPGNKKPVKIAANLVDRASAYVQQFASVRLSYLTLFRSVPTLSGGEAQRLSLMAYLSTGVESLIYIFDEPTAGLHELEKQEFLKKLKALQQLGNALIVVEHDRSTIQSAEHIIDVGPLAGQHGGEVVFEGTYKRLLRCKASVTGQYLSGKRCLAPRKPYTRVNSSTPGLTLKRVKTNNLKSISVKLPLGVVVGITGVSGCGKTSLVTHTLVPALQKHFTLTDDDNPGDSPEPHNLVRPIPLYADLVGHAHITRCIEVSQAPIGRRSNSNPATYLGIWDRIRRHFSAQPLAQERGYGPGHFSFNAQGACDNCKGSGQHRMWLGRTFVTYECSVCSGNRYQSAILDITFEGHTISDVLRLTAGDACTLFAKDIPISRMLDVLVRTGMGYITLGQPTSTLSGGEAQRLKLAKEIGRRQSRGATLFILDEPTTGLSTHDVSNLLALVDEIMGRGNSVFIIEHDPEVLSRCDWLLELGPGGGQRGGEVIAKGSPLELAQNPASLIGPFLVPVQ